MLRRRSAGKARFKIDRYTQDVPAMLRECYRFQVEKRGFSFQEDTETRDHLLRVSRWLVGASNKPGLFLFGEPGNGKSTMAKAVSQLIQVLYASNSYDDRKSVRMISALELAEAARGEKSELIRNLKATDLLYIDDVGTEPAAVKVWGNEVSPLVDLLYYRYEFQLFTVITSNLTGEEDIRQRYGDRVNDRFTEMFDQLEFENKSYRPRLTTLTAQGVP